jgi:hypothetical protein
VSVHASLSIKVYATVTEHGGDDSADIDPEKMNARSTQGRASGGRKREGHGKGGGVGPKVWEGCVLSKRMSVTDCATAMAGTVHARGWEDANYHFFPRQPNSDAELEQSEFLALSSVSAAPHLRADPAGFSNAAPSLVGKGDAAVFFLSGLFYQLPVGVLAARLGMGLKHSKSVPPSLGAPQGASSCVWLMANQAGAKVSSLVQQGLPPADSLKAKREQFQKMKDLEVAQIDSQLEKDSALLQRMNPGQHDRRVGQSNAGNMVSSRLLHVREKGGECSLQFGSSCSVREHSPP